MEVLPPDQARVLGCLLEKERTTPDVYPLTVNALVSACNQTTNRDPIVRYVDADVQRTLDELRARGLTRVVYSPSNRAPKHRQVADDALGLGADEAALICLLLLRGAQTSGELRTRSERLHAFAGLDEVEAALERLAGRVEPLVVRLDRVPGQKEARWAQLLTGPPAPPSPFSHQDRGPGAPTPVREAVAAADEGRLAALEEQVETLRAEIDALWEQLGGH